MWELALEVLHDEIELVSSGLIWFDMHFIVSDDLDVLLLDLELACFENALTDRFDCNLELESLNGFQVNLN